MVEGRLVGSSGARVDVTTRLDQRSPGAVVQMQQCVGRCTAKAAGRPAGHELTIVEHVVQAEHGDQHSQPGPKRRAPMTPMPMPRGHQDKSSKAHDSMQCGSGMCHVAACCTYVIGYHHRHPVRSSNTYERVVLMQAPPSNIFAVLVWPPDVQFTKNRVFTALHCIALLLSARLPDHWAK